MRGPSKPYPERIMNLLKLSERNTSCLSLLCTTLLFQTLHSLYKKKVSVLTKLSLKSVFSARQVLGLC